MGFWCETLWTGYYNCNQRSNSTEVYNNYNGWKTMFYCCVNYKNTTKTKLPNKKGVWCSQINGTSYMDNYTITSLNYHLYCPEYVITLPTKIFTTTKIKLGRKPKIFI